MSYEDYIRARIEAERAIREMKRSEEVESEV